MDLRMEWCGLDLTQDRDPGKAVVNTLMNLRIL
jgi:hypothetical protein